MLPHNLLIGPNLRPEEPLPFLLFYKELSNITRQRAPDAARPPSSQPRNKVT